MRNCPCKKDCTRRRIEEPNCHMVCEEFLEWERRKNDANRRREAIQEVDDYIVRTVIKRGKKK